jgi:hypothetical protein
VTDVDWWTSGSWTAATTRGPVLLAAALVLVLVTALISGGHARGLWSWTRHSWMQQQAVALLMNLLIVGVVLAGLLYDGWSDVRDWRSLDPLRLFAVWVFSFLPGWLFVRFLGQRAGTLWAEYVEALHRLRMDSPGALPQPARQSRYYAAWKEAVGDAAPARTLYQAKFDAYYGKDVARAAQLGTPGKDGNDRTQVRTDTLFPVFLATAVLAVGWTAVLRDTSFVTQPSNAADLVKFGFLGAYSFTVQMLMRRFFQSDLRASAYASATLRILTVTILVAVVYQLPGFRGEHMRNSAVVMFVIGFFPLVGMQALTRAGEIFLRTLVPSLNPAYPLNQVDGLNIWYESRLLEEGIEDMENLATADLVDVLLHTRVPVGRLVDWVDQVHLYQHLDRSELSRREARQARRKGDRDGSTVRHVLRNCGVRTATDLLKAFPPDEVTPESMSWLREQGLNPKALHLIVQVLDDEPALEPVWNWQEGGAAATGERSRRREASAGSAGRAGSRAPRPA